MALNAVIDTTLLYVKRHGNTDFAPDLAAGESQVSAAPGQFPLPGVPLYYQTVVGGVFVALTAPERAAVDAARAELARQRVEGAVRITRIVPLADLPIPPPAVGLVVGVTNGPGGRRGIAISTPTGWELFASDASIP